MELDSPSLSVSLREELDTFEFQVFHTLLYVGSGSGFLDLVEALCDPFQKNQCL